MSGSVGIQDRGDRGFCKQTWNSQRCFGGYHGYKHGGSKVKGLCYQKLRIDVWPSQLSTDQARPAELVRNKRPPSFSTLPGQEVAPTASHLLPHPVSKEAPKISFPKEMATHCSILAWEIPWTEEPGGLQSMGSQRVRRDLATKQQWHKVPGFTAGACTRISSPPPAAFVQSPSFTLWWLRWSPFGAAMSTIYPPPQSLKQRISNAIWLSTVCLKFFNGSPSLLGFLHTASQIACFPPPSVWNLFPSFF